MSLCIGAGDLAPKESSSVLPVKMKKDGSYSGRPLVSEADFEDLRRAVREKLEVICAEMAGGRIDIAPMRSKDGMRSACRYCDFRGICRFDRGYAGNRYVLIAADKETEKKEETT